MGKRGGKRPQKNLSPKTAYALFLEVPDKILRAIIETVDKQKLSDVHALRSGTGGSDSQLKRGSDKAQRRDIDRDLHLHYWECAHGRVELASVVIHNDFSIPKVTSIIS